MPTIHNPSNFNPEHYAIVDYLDSRMPVFFFDPLGNSEEQAKMHAQMRRDHNAQFAQYYGWRNRERGVAVIPQHCDHCGHWLRYVCVAEYHPPGADAPQYICMGQDCADRAHMTLDQFRLNVLMEAARKRDLTVKLGSRYLRLLEDHPDLREAFEQNEARKGFWHNAFIADVFHKAKAGRELTQPQINAVIRVNRNNEERMQKQKTQRAAEQANASPVPVTDERVRVEGVVASTKWVESDYGDTLKMLLLTDAGYKLWGTVPRAIVDLEKGDRVAFTARLERSRDDETFGFYSRPTKAEIVTEAA